MKNENSLFSPLTLISHLRTWIPMLLRRAKLKKGDAFILAQVVATDYLKEMILDQLEFGFEVVDLRKWCGVE